MLLHSFKRNVLLFHIDRKCLWTFGSLTRSAHLHALFLRPCKPSVVFVLVAYRVSGLMYIA